MVKKWFEQSLLEYVEKEIEESLNLDYKAAGSLYKSPEKKSEITKDVSAMANSDGGIIIYGLKEHSDKKKQHLAQKLDPIDRQCYSKEWLEHIINNIRPKITGLLIHPVNLSSGGNHVAYVVEIPKSSTAHQAQDKKYYKRFNFESVAMEDYEIRDILNRSKHPIIQIDLKLIEDTPTTRFEPQRFTLWVRYSNVGRVYANYINGFLFIPRTIYDPLKSNHVIVRKEDGVKCVVVEFSNIHRDVVGKIKGFEGHGSMPDIAGREFFATRYEPLLPKLSREFSVPLSMGDRGYGNLSKQKITWSVFADNAREISDGARLEDMSNSYQHSFD
jgi:hypothetical protein